MRKRAKLSVKTKLETKDLKFCIYFITGQKTLLLLSIGRT